MVYFLAGGTDVYCAIAPIVDGYFAVRTESKTVRVDDDFCDEPPYFQSSTTVVVPIPSNSNELTLLAPLPSV